jgi:DNA adenine methylase
MLISPLRYPGGKASLADYIARVLAMHGLEGCTFFEPYVGGASVSLYLLQQGLIKKAVWNEKDPLIYALWHCVINDPDKLISAIIKLPISIETWQEFQKYRRSLDPVSEYSILELGLAGLFFNRTNFSGVLGAGPIGGITQESKYLIDCRFNKQRLIDLISEISRFGKQIKVTNNDAIEHLKKELPKTKSHKCFIYIDPPYYKQGPRLYRYSYKEVDHQNLASFLANVPSPWLVSYDNHTFITDLYKNKNSQPIYTDYKMKNPRQAMELIISNLVIPPECFNSVAL